MKADVGHDIGFFIASVEPYQPAGTRAGQCWIFNIARVKHIARTIDFG